MEPATSGEGKRTADRPRFQLDRCEPWPDVVEGADLLADLAAAFRCYLALPEGAPEAMALWVVFTHAFEAAESSPRLALLSPLPECGKTTALTLLGRLTVRSVLASNLSPAVVFRIIEEQRPTLLLDECDTYMEHNEEFRGILNSGHMRDTAAVWRCVGEDHTPQRFDTWAPMALAKIGALHPTLASRSIIIQMRRKRPEEDVERFRPLHASAMEELARKAARWVSDNLGRLTGADPELPVRLGSRAADNWRPLIAVADAAGGHWPETARRAAVLLSGNDEELSHQIMLLMDIQAMFEGSDRERMPSETICSKLTQLKDRPWCEWRNRSEITQTQLAGLLRPFDIKPHSIRVGERTPKGYELAQFEDAFARYLPRDCNTATSEENQGVEPQHERNMAA